MNSFTVSRARSTSEAVSISKQNRRMSILKDKGLVAKDGLRDFTAYESSEIQVPSNRLVRGATSSACIGVKELMK